MGKEVPQQTTAEMIQKKKKKGRPPKNPLSTPPKPINYDSTPNRRNPKNLNSPPPEFDDDDDERKEKKVKLVVRLPQVEENRKINQQHSRDDESNSSSDSDDRKVYAKKRKTNAIDRGSEDAVSVQVVKKTRPIPHGGSPLDSGPTTPLPDKKFLLFILDRIQKKDTYGVFSEPVDPDELPDYYEVIEQPMDFGTLRDKLDGGAYKNLEELEADVFLICSNAMQYNAPDTVYYRQAHSILEIAKRDFENLRHEGDDGEPQPKVVRRGRPPGNRNHKKLLETFPAARVAPELSSEDKPTESNPYNLRKGIAQCRFRTRLGEYSEWSADWNDEFPASIIRADMKYGKKQFTVDENRRFTFSQYNSPLLSSSTGEVTGLVPVGLTEPLGYARSLAIFAANLGPVAWKVASKRIETVLPPGVQYGPGWVGENGSSSQHLSFSTEKQKSPLTSDLSSGFAEGMIEAVKKFNNSQNEIISVQGDANSWINRFPVQHNPVHQIHGNNNVFSGYPCVQGRGGSGSYERLNFGGPSTWQTVPMQQRHNDLSVAPDLNGSPSTSGLPQHPDLALQL